jgi:DUF1680 family protein
MSYHFCIDESRRGSSPWRGVFLAALVLCFSHSACGEEICAVPLAQVRLTDGPFKERQDLHRRVILSYDVDRLLHNFRVNAGLPSSAAPYGGWESPGVGLRGHFTGHYLSACSLMYAATGDAAFLERVDRLVSELAIVQGALGGGYLSAFPATEFDVLETKFFDGVWAPYYTIHKIMAGLIDAHEQAGNAQALEVAVRLADYFDARVARLAPEAVEQMTRTDYKGNPVNEFGGIAVSLLDLQRLTGDARYGRLARTFMREWFIAPLAAGEDRLAGLHANTHVPQAMSLALAGDARLEAAADFFWSQVTQRHSFAFGGNAFDEKFGQPGVEAADLTDLSGETCNTHNMLKLTRALFERRPDARYADYFEHALYNHILASVAPDTGVTTYHVSSKPGHFKVYGTHEHSMWCCTGSGIENTARYGEGVYYANADTLWVNLYIPSVVSLPAHGLTLTQDTSSPADDRVQFTVKASRPVALSVRLRRPAWLAGDPEVRVNDSVAATATSETDGFLVLQRTWHDGDRIELRLPMAVRVRPAMDDPGTVSFYFGPVLLAGELGREQMPPSDSTTNQGEFRQIPVPRVPALASIGPAALTPVSGEPLRFIAPVAGGSGTVSFIPFFDLHHQRYSIYWRAD